MPVSYKPYWVHYTNEWQLLQAGGQWASFQNAAGASCYMMRKWTAERARRKKRKGRREKEEGRLTKIKCVTRWGVCGGCPPCECEGDKRVNSLSTHSSVSLRLFDVIFDMSNERQFQHSTVIILFQKEGWRALTFFWKESQTNRSWLINVLSTNRAV